MTTIKQVEASAKDFIPLKGFNELFKEFLALEESRGHNWSPKSLYKFRELLVLGATMERLLSSGTPSLTQANESDKATSVETSSRPARVRSESESEPSIRSRTDSNSNEEENSRTRVRSRGHDTIDESSSVRTRTRRPN